MGSLTGVAGYNDMASRSLRSTGQKEQTQFGAGTAILGSGAPGSGTIQDQPKTGRKLSPQEMQSLGQRYQNVWEGSPEVFEHRREGAADSTGQYYQFTDKQGNQQYYVPDSMNFYVGKQGDQHQYDVPNLYLAYRQKVPNADQYVQSLESYRGAGSLRLPASQKTNGRSYTLQEARDLLKAGGDEWAVRPNYMQNQTFGLSKNDLQQLVSDFETSNRGMLFREDPFKYGSTKWTKKAHKLSAGEMLTDFARGALPLAGLLLPVLGPAFGVGAKAMAAGMGAAGAIANPDDPLKGAVAAGGGSLLPGGLGKLGIENQVLQRALSSAILAEIGDQNALLAAGKGALSGFAQPSAGGAQPVDSGLKGGSEMAGWDDLFSGGGGSSSPSFGGGGGLDTSSFGSDMNLGGGMNFSGGGGEGLSLGGSGSGGGSGDWDFGSNFQSLAPMGGGSDYGLQFGGGTGLKLDDMGGLGLQAPGAQNPGIDASNWGPQAEQFKGFGGPGVGGGMNLNMDSIKGALGQLGTIMNNPIMGRLGNVLAGRLEKRGAQNAQQQYKQIAQQAAEKADPFAGQRSQYQSQLSQLFANPSSIYETPMFKARQQQAIDAVKRMNSARGYYDSGNEEHQVGETAAAGADEAFRWQADQLAKLSGAYANPGAAGAAYAMAGQGVPLGMQASGADGYMMNEILKMMQQGMA